MEQNKGHEMTTALFVGVFWVPDIFPVSLMDKGPCKGMYERLYQTITGTPMSTVSGGQQLI